MAEAVRVLRGNLSFTGVDGDVRSILITSSIRSEGKSVTLAAAHSQSPGDIRSFASDGIAPLKPRESMAS